MELQRAAPAWLNGMTLLLSDALTSGVCRRPGTGELPSHSVRAADLSLVDNKTIEAEILSSRLALAMMDRASWEFSDLRSRMLSLERHEELDVNDVLRPHVLSRIVTSRLAGRRAEPRDLAPAAAGAARRVLEFRRRGLPRGQPLAGAAARAARDRPATVHPALAQCPSGQRLRRVGDAASTGFSRASGSGGDDGHTLAAQARAMSQANANAGAVLGRLNRLISRHLPEFASTTRTEAASPGLKAAISEAQQGIQQRLMPAGRTEPDRSARRRCWTNCSSASRRSSGRQRRLSSARRSRSWRCCSRAS